jgi:hypothetical protein
MKALQLVCKGKENTIEHIDGKWHMFTFSMQEEEFFLAYYTKKVD